MRRVFPTLLAGLLGLGLAACDDGTGPSVSTLRVEMTDAASQYIDGAWVDIGRVDLLPANNEAPIVLSDDGTDGLVNLLDLTGTATMAIAEADVEPGESYFQLRLVVEAARVKLAEGYTFNAGGDEMNLFVPSGAETGIKLELANADGDPDDGFVVPEGETVLVVDFDVNQSFVINGDPETPAGIEGILFEPVLRAVLEDVSSSMSGRVTSSITDFPPEKLNGLTVTATPQSETFMGAHQTETATAVTAGEGDAVGTFQMDFLVPATYTVSVTLPDGDTFYDGLTVDPVEVEVSEATAVSDLILEIVEQASGG